MIFNVNKERIDAALLALAGGDRKPWTQIFGTPDDPVPYEGEICIERLDLKSYTLHNLFLPKGTVVERLVAEDARLTMSVLHRIRVQKIEGTLHVSISSLSESIFMTGKLSLTAKHVNLSRTVFGNEDNTTNDGYELLLRLTADSCGMVGTEFFWTDLRSSTFCDIRTTPDAESRGYVKFEGCRMTEVSMAGQDLRGALFTDCDCSLSRFDEADLRHVIMRRVKMYDAHFTDAKWNMPIKMHSTLDGLELVHGIPSAMQTYLVLKALGKI